MSKWIFCITIAFAALAVCYPTLSDVTDKELPTIKIKEKIGSKLPICPTNRDVKWHNCFGRLALENEDVYVGEFQNDKGNGKGQYFYRSGGWILAISKIVCSTVLVK